MSTQHKIGGRKAQGFAALSRKQRSEAARIGGKACYKNYGRTYLADIGRRGAMVRYGKKEAA